MGRLIWTEVKLAFREPLVVAFVFLFPIMTSLVLGGVYGPGGDEFLSIKPTHWYAAAYFGVVMTAVCLVLTPVQLAHYREVGVTRRFRVSRFRPTDLPLAVAATSTLMILVGSIALAVAATLAYGLPTVESPVRTVAAYVAATAMFVSLGLLLGTLLPSGRSAQGVGLLLLFPFFLLGGGGPPTGVMPDAMKLVSDALPSTYAIRGIQEAWLGTGNNSAEILIMLIFTAVFGGLLAIAVSVRTRRGWN